MTHSSYLATFSRASFCSFLLVCCSFFSPTLLAIPTDYEIFLTSDPSNQLGSFTVDPALASAVGESSVQMSALTFTEEVSPFGELTVTLADVNPASLPSIRAIFWDGDISEISAIAPGTLPGGISFFLDFTPKGDPSIINLDAIGTYALDAFDGTTFGDSATGSIGIREATVPEPATLGLMGLSFLVLALRRIMNLI